MYFLVTYWFKYSWAPTYKSVMIQGFGETLVNKAGKGSAFMKLMFQGREIRKKEQIKE